MKLAVISDIHANLHALEAVCEDLEEQRPDAVYGLGDLDDCGCVYQDPDDVLRGQRSLLWSRAHTTDANKTYLCSLPIQIRLEDRRPTVLVVHGSPRRINEYLYEDRPQATFERIAAAAGADVILFGHTHIPYQRWVGGTVFVNAGSVGKPRDGDPRASYVILELARRPRAQFRRVAYDVAAATRAVRESGLPPHFADLLETGGLATRRAAAASARVAP